MNIFKENEPIFKFAIREDLKDNEISFLPTRATTRSSGWDVRAAFWDKRYVELNCGELIKIPLGFRAFCPDGWWFELKPRSSTFGKKNLHCLYGTIDEDYEGELLLAAQYLPENIGRISPLGIEMAKPKLIIGFGEALGQIVPVRRQEMTVEQITNEEYDELCKKRNAERGTGGFGSSGK